jgi:hypothetical protein
VDVPYPLGVWRLRQCKKAVLIEADWAYRGGNVN